ncbi:MAG: OmpA family protein [Salinivirgaceae bacterium]|nr:OmpA family protein [Salinivirgaceae bacterium]
MASSFHKFILCISALLLASTTSVAQIDLFPNFNGTVSSPALSHDGSKLIFIGINETSTAVYESRNNNGNWSEPTIIPIFSEELQNANVGGFSFNHDASQLLFHAKVDSTFDIYYLTFNNNKWQNLTKIGQPISSNEDDFSPTLSVDNNYMFLLRPKTKTKSKKSDDVCKELVLYYRNNDNEWVGPNMLPKSFNEGCQESPFLCADGKTLFFSSMRPDTTPNGAKTPDDVYNIYYTQLISGTMLENNWYLPQYQGWASSDFNDLSPRVNQDGSIFLKSNYSKKTSKKHPNKTYQYEINPNVKPLPTMTLHGTIKDSDTGLPMKAQITLTDAISSASLASYSTDPNGQYVVYLNENMNYKIDFSGEGYSHSYLNISTDFFTEDIDKQFDTTLFSTFSYNLNVYDDELYIPLKASISIRDSASNELIIDSMNMIGNGQYSTKLNIGRTYKFHVECEHFTPHDFYLNAIADLFYNEFEEDIELSPTKTIMILDVDAGESNDSVIVNVKNLSRNETKSVIAKRDKDGNLIVELREGDSYEIDVAKKGYTFNSTKVNATKSKKAQKLNIKLDLLTKDTKMTFNNIAFETNSAEITAGSFTELNRLIEFLNLNNDIKIELSAHTDDVGSDFYNMRLSDKRAKSVATYLINNGISESQLISKGYGESQPLVPNSSDENRALNRRVEVKIIE